MEFVVTGSLSIVLVFPKLIEKPYNVSVAAGKTFELHCRAQGHPDPVLSWQKDGGTSFPAANDRRMDYLPASKVYVIKNAQYVDTGKYTCSATNEAGSVNATAFVTVLGKGDVFRFHFIGDTVAFYPQTQKLQPPGAT